MSKLIPFWKYKKAIHYCPSGEQITNGGFETGDTTGWTTYSYVQSEYKHSGNYALAIEFAGSRQAKPVLPVNIPVRCIDVFKFWYMKEAFYEGTLIIGYAEGGETAISLPITGLNWTEVDVLPLLEADKTISEIVFINSISYYLYLDDVTLTCTGVIY